MVSTRGNQLAPGLATPNFSSETVSSLHPDASTQGLRKRRQSSSPKVNRTTPQKKRQKVTESRSQELTDSKELSNYPTAYTQLYESANPLPQAQQNHQDQMGDINRSQMTSTASMAHNALLFPQSEMNGNVPHLASHDSSIEIQYPQHSYNELNNVSSHLEDIHLKTQSLPLLYNLVSIFDHVS